MDVDGWWVFGVIVVALPLVFIVYGLGSVERRLKDVIDVLERQAYALERQLDR